MTVTVSAVRPEQASDYVHTHLELLNTTYAHLMDANFARRRRTEFDARVAELLADIEETREADAEGRPARRRHFIAHTDRGSVVGVAAAGDGVGDWEEPYFGAAWYPPATTFCLDHLYTTPGTHGTGLGLMLLNAALPGARSAYLWVYAENARALRFYERNGFRPDGLAGTSGVDWGDLAFQRMSRPGSKTEGNATKLAGFGTNGLNG